MIMANYEQLKASIIAAIYDNGNQEITGDVLQSVLLGIVNIIGANATLAGVAETGTIPGSVDQNAFYIASAPGYYSGFGLTADKQGVNIFFNKSGSWEVANFTSFKTYPNSVTTINESSSAAQVKAAFTPVGFVNPTIPNLGDHIQIQNDVSNNGAMFYYVEHFAGVVLRLLFCPTPEYVYYMTVDTSAWTVDKVEKYQISKLDDLIEWVGTPQDPANPTGSIFARLAENAADILALKDAVGNADSEPSATGDLFGRVKYLENEPSLHDLWLKAGATYQAKTNTYTLNGVSGLTRDNMLVSWAETNSLYLGANSVAKYRACKFITNFLVNKNSAPKVNYGSKNFRYAFYLCSKARVINITDGYIFANNIGSMFDGCYVLETIKGIINCEDCDSNDKFYSVFGNCVKLESVKLHKIKHSISINSSPNLTVEDTTDSSLGCMVENAANESPITITLHADAFARVPETLIQKAQAKQISIVSA